MMSILTNLERLWDGSRVQRRISSHTYLIDEMNDDELTDMPYTTFLSYRMINQCQRRQRPKRHRQCLDS